MTKTALYEMAKRGKLNRLYDLKRENPIEFMEKKNRNIKMDCATDCGTRLRAIHLK